MRQIARSALVPLTALALATAAVAQAPPAAKTADPAARKAAPPAATTKTAPPAAATKAAPAPSPDEVLATVNGEKITRGELIDFLSRYPLPPNLSEQQVYDTALNSLINTKLLTQFLGRTKVAVAEKEVNEALASIEKDLKDTQKKDLASAMQETNTSMADLRDKIVRRLQWRNYVLAQATEPQLKTFAEENKEAINGAQVKASHILLPVEPDAKPEEKEQARQKLLGIKKEIESGKISFAEAANKYSEDPLNVQSKNGGDLDFFPRKGLFIEEFSAAAFGLKKGAVSDPVETKYGYHLIQVTDRKEGQPIDFAQMKDQITNMFAADLQERIIADERKAAKITTKPLPPDLFQAPPAENPAAAPAGTPAPSGAAPVPKGAGATPAPKPAAPAPKAAGATPAPKSAAPAPKAAPPR